MSKRTLHSFFSPPAKRSKNSLDTLSRRVSPPQVSKEPTSATAIALENAPSDQPINYTAHPGYAFPIADLPPNIAEKVEELLLTASGKAINNQPHLDLLYFEPLIPQPTADQLFRFLRSSLPFYRVKYTITRFGKSVDINTPRFTTVYGLDATSQFISTPTPSPSDPKTTQLTSRIVETTNPTKDVPPTKYKSCTVPPRPIPPCLAMLKNLTEALTNDTYNFVLVNYYSTGQDSISYHSDDERFLGPTPAIASFSLGARRDFLMKHKPPGAGPGNGSKTQPTSTSEPGSAEKVYPGTTQLKLPLGPGDMILMRGETQRNWLHSIPKRSGKNDKGKGRLNITMRKAMVPGGTENYYQYNVGTGPVYRWDEAWSEMRLWEEMKLERGGSSV
ncbi:hypothetical protein LTR70_006413 [Exophiala xenobiotica]|uniref:Fe2OG dioxygenase domain-containing protein n=1 Tax=Lithohypha guttulata TaxID=1690604 RepID=A0ABR0K302_9EURO|nr:hypothetical protein LTR24_007386 [Lithohypha guttulata]KAK5316245.1 hypothetical protein LTR70_006413 [Exophiala xenobiotica]